MCRIVGWARKSSYDNLLNRYYFIRWYVLFIWFLLIFGSFFFLAARRKFLHRDDEITGNVVVVAVSFGLYSALFLCLFVFCNCFTIQVALFSILVNIFIIRSIIGSFCIKDYYRRKSFQVRTFFAYLLTLLLLPFV